MQVSCEVNSIRIYSNFVKYHAIHPKLDQCAATLCANYFRITPAVLSGKMEVGDLFVTKKTFGEKYSIIISVVARQLDTLPRNLIDILSI